MLWLLEIFEAPTLAGLFPSNWHKKTLDGPQHIRFWDSGRNRYLPASPLGLHKTSDLKEMKHKNSCSIVFHGITAVQCLPAYNCAIGWIWKKQFTYAAINLACFTTFFSSAGRDPAEYMHRGFLHSMQLIVAWTFGTNKSFLFSLSTALASELTDADNSDGLSTSEGNCP